MLDQKELNIVVEEDFEKITVNKDSKPIIISQHHMIPGLGLGRSRYKMSKVNHLMQYLWKIQ